MFHHSKFLQRQHLRCSYRLSLRLQAQLYNQLLLQFLSVQPTKTIFGSNPSQLDLPVKDGSHVDVSLMRHLKNSSLMSQEEKSTSSELSTLNALPRF